MASSTIEEKLSEEIESQAIVVAVDAVFLLKGALGFKGELSNAAKKGLIKTISFAIKSCKKTLSAIFAFGSAWTLAKGNVIKQALAVLQLLYGMKYEIVWAIVKGCYQNMSTYGWLMTVATFSLSVLANFTPKGLALLINFGLTCDSAAGFAGEVEKLVKLQQDRKVLTKCC